MEYWNVPHKNFKNYRKPPFPIGQLKYMYSFQLIHCFSINTECLYVPQLFLSHDDYKNTYIFFKEVFILRKFHAKIPLKLCG